MLIDIHAHLIGLREENGCYVAPEMRSSLLFKYLKLTLGLSGVDEEQLDAAYRERMVEWIEDSELDGVGILALDGVYDEAGELDREQTSVLVDNDYCLEVCGGSDKLLPICSVNPQRADAIEELERVVARGAVAIKLLPNSQGINYLLPEYRAFWQRMARLGVPLLTHASFEHTIPVVEQAFGHPDRLRPVLDEGVTVIAAHCASAGVAHITEHIDVWLDMLRTYPNLYGDISAMASMARFPYISTVLEDSVARERILLGSDFPIPVSPWLFTHKVGWGKMRELVALENPFQKNLETFRALGCGQGVLRRGMRLLKI